MTAIRAVLLDVGDTLFRVGPFPDLPPLVTAALADAGFNHAQDAAREALAGLRSATNAVSPENGWREVKVATVVARRLASLPRPDALRAGRVVDAVLGQADVSRFAEGHSAPPVLRGLRARGLRLVAVSNTLTPPGMIRSHPVARPALAELDGMVFSVEFGIRKPGPEIYRHALVLAGVSAAEALFVGDRHREDIAGPMAAGMRAVLTHQFRCEDPGPERPLAVISDLGELSTIISRASG